LTDKRDGVFSDNHPLKSGTGNGEEVIEDTQGHDIPIIEVIENMKMAESSYVRGQIRRGKCVWLKHI
jgi:hypothetical protein